MINFFFLNLILEQVDGMEGGVIDINLDLYKSIVEREWEWIFSCENKGINCLWLIIRSTFHSSVNLISKEVDGT